MGITIRERFKRQVNIANSEFMKGQTALLTLGDLRLLALSAHEKPPHWNTQTNANRLYIYISYAGILKENKRTNYVSMCRNSKTFQSV